MHKRKWIERRLSSKIASESIKDEFLEIETSIGSNDQCNIEKQAEHTCCKGCTSRDATLQNILKQNHLIRVMLTDVLKELRELKQNTTKKAEGPKISFLNKFPGLKFPLNIADDVIEFENILNRNEEFEDGVNELYKMGGDNGYQFVRRVLGTLLTDNLAMEYSWLGRKGKKSFHKLNIANLVIHAAEKAKIAGSRRETESSIQLWLKRAKDRMVQTTKKF
ncbi:uncharacterized protein LOC143353354 isoform X2 [Halictus rubicundus]|uniref:uncharacterized protein LOC143353354 isoform X2 n=1 Tax=Halictus rubicundus TaxID=77578 RepID=UPI004035C8A4